MAFDDVLSIYVGEMGRSQILIILMIAICLLPDPFDTMEIVYTQATPSFTSKGELWLMDMIDARLIHQHQHHHYPHPFQSWWSS